MDILEKSKELLEESKKRRSTREFLPDALDMEVIKNCIMTGATAPNGADMQPWHFVVVTDDEMKRKIRAKSEEIESDFHDNKISEQWDKDLEKLKVNASKPFLTQAPCLIVIFKEMYRIMPDGTHAPNYYVAESVGIATGLLINALRNVGYATLTYTPAPMTFLREMLGRPANETPEMILVVGKPDPAYQLPVLEKKPFEQIADII